MADIAGNPVTVSVRNAIDDLGVPLDDGNASATVTILELDQSTVIVATTPMVWNAALPGWLYRWSTVGQVPRTVWAKVAVTPLGGEASVSWEEIVLLAPPQTTELGACGAPWVEADEVECLDGVDAELAGLVVLVASRLLWAAAGRRFYGICTDTVSPNPMSGGRLVPYGDGWFIERGSLCAAVELPGTPIVDVTRVTIDGTDLAAGSWTIVDDRYVIRKDSEPWPSTNRVDRIPGQPGTWTMEYRFGEVPPPEGVLAGRVLSCELKKAVEGDSSCRLPKRLQSITREGMTAVILDPFSFFDKGLFGLYETDSFVNAVNPHHVTREARVLNVDLLAHAPRRVR